MLQKAIKGSRWRTDRRRVMPARCPADRHQGVGEGRRGCEWLCKRKSKRSGIMSEDGRDRFEIPKEMRTMAEASFDQARKAFDKFLAGAQQTAGSLEERSETVRAGAKDISTKPISHPQKTARPPPNC